MLEKLKRFNWLMFVAMLALVALGTAAIYSAGNARTEEVFHSMWKANLSTAVFGLAIYFVLAFFDYRRYLNLRYRGARVDIRICRRAAVVAEILRLPRRAGGDRSPCVAYTS